MKHHVVLLGALLIAAPVFSQHVLSQDQDVLTFALTESSAQVIERLGKPALIASFGEFETWQYQIGVEDHHEFSHVLMFRAATRELVSVTRNWEQERTVDEMFPVAETKTYFYPDAAHPEYGVRVRRLSGGRVLLAMGSSKPGEPTGQVMLIRETDLHFFQDWLYRQLAATH